MKYFYFSLLFLFLSCNESTEIKKKENAPNLKDDLIIHVEEKSEDEITPAKDALVQVGFDGVANKKLFNSLFKKDQIEIEGELNLEFDDFNHKNHYFINSKNEKNYIEPLEDIHFALGKKILFRGLKENDKNLGYVVSTSGTPQKLPPPKPGKTEIKKMLVLLTYFQDRRKPNLKPTDLHHSIFDGVFNRFYREISNGAIEHRGDVKGWYKIERDEASIGGMICRVTNEEIQSIIEQENIKLQDYDVITYISSCETYHTIGGRTQLNAVDHFGKGHPFHLIEMASNPDILDNHSFSDSYWSYSGIIGILLHERGHNFEMNHSNGLYCKDKIIGANCDNVEYGNHLDLMGSRSTSLTPNAYQLVKAGFRSPTDIMEISKSGIYTIDKLSSTKKGSKIGAYIINPITKEKIYLVEYRRGEDFDPYLSWEDNILTTQGLQIYTMKVPNYTSYFYGAALLDPHPEKNKNWWQNIQFESLREKFEDKVEGVNIEFLSINEQDKTLTFKVDFYPEQSVCKRNYTATTFLSSTKAKIQTIPPSTGGEDGGVIWGGGPFGGLIGGANSPKNENQNSLKINQTQPTELEYYPGDNFTVNKGDRVTLYISLKNRKSDLRCSIPEIKIDESSEITSQYIKVATPKSIISGLPNTSKSKQVKLNKIEDDYFLFSYDVEENAPIGESTELKIKFRNIEDSTQSEIIKKFKITVGHQRSGGLLPLVPEIIDSKVTK